jgi:hypothetical protein
MGFRLMNYAVPYLDYYFIAVMRDLPPLEICIVVRDSVIHPVSRAERSSTNEADTKGALGVAVYVTSKVTGGWTI